MSDKQDLGDGWTTWHSHSSAPCGLVYVWNVKDAFGAVCERWVIPSEWVRPHVASVTGEVDHYEVRPMGRTDCSGMLRIPACEITVSEKGLTLTQMNELFGQALEWSKTHPLEAAGDDSSKDAEPDKVNFREFL